MKADHTAFPQLSQ